MITEASRAANFTNEGGVDGRVRFLRNVGGLWLLQESLRDVVGRGPGADLAVLLRGAPSVAAGGPVIDVDDDPAFIAPDDMPARIRAACRAAGQPVPDDSGEHRPVHPGLAGDRVRAHRGRRPSS